MNREFVRYQESLELKELGFDEPCFGRYNVPGEFILSGCYSDSPLVHILVEQNDICEAHTLAPTLSQAFRWFREKHNFCSCITPSSEKTTIKYEYGIFEDGYLNLREIKGGFKTYEEAELECLRKLIELVK